MSMQQINGFQLEQMLNNGLARLQAQEEEINRLNVFPVSDGDTGTNMRLTLESGLRCAEPDAHAGRYLSRLSKGMLLGARGNSGVILSQFFKGVYTALADCAAPGVEALCAALTNGYQIAYKAVVTPAEGTILTVTREGIEHIRGQINSSLSVEELFTRYIASMKQSLAKTPELLPVLKEAGVVDSGALGFIAVAEGMLQALSGEVIAPAIHSVVPQLNRQPDDDLFDENSAFEDGYCMEFILQLMNAPRYDHSFALDRFIGALHQWGNSIVAVQDGKRVKVHIHTLTPADIITHSQQFGEFLTFKLENMQVQHNRRDKALSTNVPRKPLAIAAVVNGDGMKQLFRALGCDAVIDGGVTMNTSSQEFIDAVSPLNADAIAILPNNPNVILAAEQAAAISGAAHVTVLPSRSVAEGYFAIAMDVPGSDDVAFRLREMRGGLNNTRTVCETTASRDYADGGLRCCRGDEIALIDGKLVCVDSDWLQALLGGLAAVEDIGERETCVIFRGSGTDEAQAEALRAAVEARYPQLETEIIDGGQRVYHWIAGVT